MIKTIDGISYKLVSVEYGGCEHCEGLASTTLCNKLGFDCNNQKHLACKKINRECANCLFLNLSGKCITNICAKTI